MLKKLLSFFEEESSSESEDELISSSLPPVFHEVASSTIPELLETKECSGIVTGVYDDYGLINHEIYFSLADVLDGHMPSVGDKVYVTAERGQRGSGGWRAKSLYKTSTQNYWDDADYDPTEEPVIVDTTYTPDETMQLLQKAREEFLNQNRIVQENHERTMTELLADKGNIMITDSVDFGNLEFGDSVSSQLRIRNAGSTVRTLYSMTIQDSDNFTESQFDLSKVRLDSVSLSDVSRKAQESLPLVLDPGQSACVTVFCHARKIGRERLVVIFEIDDFTIGRTLAVNVHDFNYSIQSSQPFQKKSFSSNPSPWVEDGEEFIIPGRRLGRSGTSIRQNNRLGQYSLPESIKSCMKNGKNITAIVPALNNVLTADNYKLRFSALLHLEEFQQDLEMREFDLQNVCLRPSGEYLSITVQGLTEGRPSLLVGDRVFVFKSSDYRGKAPIYEGFIHEVHRNDILIKFCEDFHIQYNFEEYNVKFTFNRSILRRCHAAVECVAKQNCQVIFPERIILKPPQVPSTKKSFNGIQNGRQKNLDSRLRDAKGEIAAVKPMDVTEGVCVKHCPNRPSNKARAESLYSTTYYNKQLNVIQKRAVQRILQGEGRPLPYIIFGPPGTGKTVTVVECILQIFHKVPYSRILVCAPSNSAVDLLTEKLHQTGLVGLSDMRRLVAFHHGQENMPADVKPYCIDGENVKMVRKVRIILSTCSSAATVGQILTSAPHNKQQPATSQHFTHVFIDEACQATEPECMVPISLLSNEVSSQVILAGDPMQLGAVLRSDAAKYFGLDISYVERLMSSPLYSTNKTKICNHSYYDSRFVTKLRHNYRSHPSLLCLTSELFYCNELIPSAPRDITDCLASLSFLPHKSHFPLIFHGIRGDAMREGNSPSWFNPQEVFQVIKYLQSIVQNDTYKISYDDVGVITPYRKQVEKIRVLMEKFGIEKVKVGSVEEFQGQERLAVILSTVRSTESMSDLESCLEFLSNPKRFNVSITRAHALLIVIGNPHVLVSDPYWYKLLRYCVDNKAYIGCDLPDLSVQAAVELIPLAWNRV